MPRLVVWGAGQGETERHIDREKKHECVWVSITCDVCIYMFRHACLYACSEPEEDTGHCVLSLSASFPWNSVSCWTSGSIKPQWASCLCLPHNLGVIGLPGHTWCIYLSLGIYTQVLVPMQKILFSTILSLQPPVSLFHARLAGKSYRCHHTSQTPSSHKEGSDDRHLLSSASQQLELTWMCQHIGNHRRAGTEITRIVSMSST